MTGPGSRVRAWAAQWCSPETMARVIDPAVADMQVEYATARARGQSIRGLRIWIAGHYALGKVLTLHGSARGIDMVSNMTVEDRRSIVGTVVWSLVTMAIVTAVLMADPLRSEIPRNPENAWTLALLLVPQALPVSIPVGLVVAILQVLRHGTLTRASRTVILGLAAALCLGSFAIMGWLIPETNQAYRQMVFHRIVEENRVSYRGDEIIARGPGELPIFELRRAIAREKAGLSPEYGGRSVSQRSLELTYYMRWALAFAPLVLTLFALAVATRLTRSRALRWFVACAVVLGYWTIYFVGDRGLNWDRSLPMFVAWAPNIAILILTAALAKLARPRDPAVA